MERSRRHYQFREAVFLPLRRQWRSESRQRFGLTDGGRAHARPPFSFSQERCARLGTDYVVFAITMIFASSFAIARNQSASALAFSGGKTPRRPSVRREMRSSS